MITRLLGWTLAICAGLAAQDAGAPVIIDGQEVVRVYGPVGSFNAKDRAPAIQERIIALAKKGYSGPVEPRAIPSESATGIIAGPIVIMAVTDVDAQSAGVPRDELAVRYAEAIREVMANYQVRHSWLNMLEGTGKVVLAWILFCAAAWAMWKGARWLWQRVDGWFGAQVAKRGVKGFQWGLWERGRIVAIAVVKVVAASALISGFSFTLSYSFGQFPQTAGISTTLLDYLASTFGSGGKAIVDYLPSGGFVLVATVVVYYVLRALKFFANAVENGDLTIKGLHPEMAKPTYQLSRLAVLLCALVVVFPYLPGGKSEAFKGISIFLGLLLSLGSSSAISNLLAGLVLTYMRPFHAGDRVKIADTIGDVQEKTLLVTRVRTIKNVEVVIPNGSILNNQILNYSALARTSGLILHTTVTIGYDAPWRKVHDLLIRAALRTDGILPSPEPFVLETSLNDFHISYELNAYTDRANAIQDTYSRLHESIQDSFNEAGVEIMSPTFYALRDGNTVTTPAAHLPAGYEAPAFRVKGVAQDRAQRTVSPSAAAD
jgi:small-conductance mechanosensitive channel